MPLYWDDTKRRELISEMWPSSSVPVSAGDAEGVQAHPVASKSDSGHGADVSVLDGYLEDLQSLTRSLSSALARRLPDPIAVRWLVALEHIDKFVKAVDCVHGCGRTAVHDTGLDGLLCDVCFTRVPASGPDEDTDYNEGAGK